MNIFGKTLGLGILAALLVGHGATTVHGFVPGGGVSVIGGSGRSVVQIRGTLVCARCNLDDIQAAQPHRNHLYELTHKQGRVVVEVTQLNDPQTPLTLGAPPRFTVRTPDQVFEQLTAEEHMFKEVEITGLLSATRTLDIFNVIIRG